MKVLFLAWVISAEAGLGPKASTRGMQEESWRGRKLVESWSGDLVDSGLAFGTGIAASFAVKLASGVASQAAIVATVVAVGAWSGVVTVHWQRLRTAFANVVPAFAKDDFTRTLDLNKDGRLSADDFDVLNTKIRKAAIRNEHSTAGALAGIVIGLTLL